MVSLGDLLLIDTLVEITATWENEDGFSFSKLLPVEKLEEIRTVHEASQYIMTWRGLGLKEYRFTDPTSKWFNGIFLLTQVDENWCYGIIFTNGRRLSQGWIDRDEVEMVEYEPDQQTT